MFLLPPVRHYFHTITGVRISVGARTATVVALFILGGQSFTNNVYEVAIQQANEQRETELLEGQAKVRTKPLNPQRTQDTSNHLNADRVHFRADDQGVPKDKRDQDVLSNTQTDVATRDPGLIAHRSQAQTNLKPQQDTERRGEILETLRSIPSEDYKRRRDLYEELVATSPNEEAALENLAFYERKYAEQVNVDQVGAQRQRNESEHAIEEALAMWAPVSVSLRDGQVAVVTKEPSVAEEMYLAMLQGICMFAPGSLHGVSEVSFLNRLSFQGLVFEGGETECKEFVQVTDKEIWVRGRTHPVLN